MILPAYGKGFAVLLVLIFSLSFLSGCAAFLEDYSYQPLGTMQPGY
jgi:hypothetical protein